MVVIEIAIRAVKSYLEDHCSLFAASITYFSLISLFPLILFAIAVSGYIVDEGGQQRIVDEVMQVIPLDEQTGRGNVEDLISGAVHARGALGIVGILGTAYASSALFGAIRASLVAVYEKEKRRPFLRAKAVDLSLVVGFTFLLALSVALTFVIALAQRYSEVVFGERFASLTAWLLTLAYPTLPAVVSFAVFYLLYTVVADAGLRRRDAAWGALFATMGFELLKVGFAQYVAYFGNYDATYGTVGFLVALLAFFNLGAQVMLFGAEIAEAHKLATLDPPELRRREVDAARDRIRRLARLPARVVWFRAGAKETIQPTAVAAPATGAADSDRTPEAARQTGDPLEPAGPLLAEAAGTAGAGGSEEQPLAERAESRDVGTRRGAPAGRLIMRGAVALVARSRRRRR